MKTLSKNEIKLVAGGLAYRENGNKIEIALFSGDVLSLAIDGKNITFREHGCSIFAPDGKIWTPHGTKFNYQNLSIDARWYTAFTKKYFIEIQH